MWVYNLQLLILGATMASSSDNDSFDSILSTESEVKIVYCLLSVCLLLLIVFYYFNRLLVWKKKNC